MAQGTEMPTSDGHAVPASFAHKAEASKRPRHPFSSSLQVLLDQAMH
jgi:hypothetical protein